MKKMTVALVLVGVCALAHADGSNWRFYSALGMASGGETITSGTITTVGTNSQVNFKVKPADGLQFRMGVDYRILQRLTLQGAIGYGVSDPMGMNGSMTFTTIPVELLGFVNITDALRIGGGMRKTSAEMKASGVSATWSGVGTYTSTPGTVVEVQYLFPISSGQPTYQRSQFGISLRYVTESFSHNSVTYDGNHYEVGMALYY